MPDIAQTHVSILRSLLMFVILGPLVISIPLGLLTSLGMGNIGGLLLIVGGAYVVGLVPAVLAGFSFYYLVRRFGSLLKRRRGRLLLGALAGFVPGATFGVPIHSLSSGTSLAPEFFFICVVSGTFCGLWASPPDKALKPTPLCGSAN
ncbi:MAG: hypothetical protein RQ736_06275 [Thiogranum sp.]|nr:hypothetical protein [Thiogranum sp.]